MKKIFFGVIIVFVFFMATNAQEGWYILSQSQSSDFSITDMKFTSSQTGYTTSSWGNGHVGFGSSAKTTNGGLNWFLLEQGVPKYGIFFLNSSTAWITGGYWSDAAIYSREIFKTTNGGANFTRVYIDSLNARFSKIFFTDENNGWVISSTQLLKTTNSGVNWASCLAQQLYSIYFINSSIGWGAGVNGYVCKTTNGGLNWTSQTIGPNTFREIFFIDVNTGWLCGGSSQIYKSTNGGTNWTPYNSGQYNTNAIEFYNSQKGWASGDSGKIVYTINGGLNWLPQNTGVNHGLGILCFPDSITGYARGGKIISIYPPFTVELIFMKTTTGGLTFIQNPNLAIPDEFFLYQNYPNPFNPVTKIKFSLPLPRLTSGHPSKGGVVYVRLVIYDILGKEVASLIPSLRGGQEGLRPGTYEVEWDASNHPSGVYFYRLTVMDASSPQANPLSIKHLETKKMILIK